jgi:hypothetical protein
MFHSQAYCFKAIKSITGYADIANVTFTLCQQAVRSTSHSDEALLCSTESFVCTLFEQAKASPYLNFSTPEYRLNSMIMDVAHHRLFKPPQINDNNPETCRQFHKLKFSNKGIDAVNLSNILRHKKNQYFLQIYPNHCIQTI